MLRLLYTLICTWVCVPFSSLINIHDKSPWNDRAQSITNFFLDFRQRLITAVLMKKFPCLDADRSWVTGAGMRTVFQKMKKKQLSVEKTSISSCLKLVKSIYLLAHLILIHNFAIYKAFKKNISIEHRLLDSLVLAWVREVPGSIPSQGPRHTKDVIKMVPKVPLFCTEHSNGKILALSQELRYEN